MVRQLSFIFPRLVLFAAVFVMLSHGEDSFAQRATEKDRAVGREMLTIVRSTIEGNYYDPTFHGTDARVQLAVAAPDGKQRVLDIASNLAEPLNTQNIPGMTAKEPIDSRPQVSMPWNQFREIGKELYIWKMSGFQGFSEQEVDAIMAGTKKHRDLILDLRGNNGGDLALLLRLIANVIDHVIKLGDAHQRKKVKQIKVDSREGEAFKGKIVVLLDSASASASELFARILQLENRGTVVGDVTAGSVMRAIHFSDHTKSWKYFATSVTVADLIITDGRSLEHVGVDTERTAVAGCG